jgi:hypothetical protein
VAAGRLAVDELTRWAPLPQAPSEPEARGSAALVLYAEHHAIGSMLLYVKTYCVSGIGVVRCEMNV